MRWDQQIFVAEFNVEHFRHKLAGDLDQAHRQTIIALLAEEECTLARLRAVAAEYDLTLLIELLAQRATVLSIRTHPSAILPAPNQHSRRSLIGSPAARV